MSWGLGGLRDAGFSAPMASTRNGFVISRAKSTIRMLTLVHGIKGQLVFGGPCFGNSLSTVVEIINADHDLEERAPRTECNDAREIFLTNKYDGGFRMVEATAQ